MTPMAMLRKVKAVISTLLEISSIQEIPEAKKYLMITFVEMMTSWAARKTEARMALTKWIRFRTSLILMRRVSFPGMAVALRRENPAEFSFY